MARWQPLDIHCSFVVLRFLFSNLFVLLNNVSKFLSRLARCLRLIVYWAIDGIISLLPASTASGGVLIVRLDAIGDFVLWQRAAANLRVLYPEERIVLAANVSWALLAHKLDYWDEVIPIEVSRLQKDPFYRWSIFYKIRRRGFSIALQPTYSRGCFYGDSMVRVSRARQRIGADGDLTNMSARQKFISDRWYTRLISTGGAAVTEIERNDELWRGLECQDFLTRIHQLPQVATLTPELIFNRPYFIVFPGAGWTGRQWSEKAFAELIDATSKSHNLLPILCGSANENLLCSNIAAHTASLVINLAGRTLLPEFCELVRRAQLVIGNETSAVHIASAVGTPSVCLLGGGHFGRFVPYPSISTGPSPEPVYEPMACFGCNWNCRLAHVRGQAVPCIAAITVAAVSAAVERVLPSTSRSILIHLPDPRGHSAAISLPIGKGHADFADAQD